MRSHEELAHSSSLRTETLVGRGGIESTAGGRLPSEGGRRIPAIAIAARKHQHAGRYSFSMPEAVVKGELRPLRNPRGCQLMKILTPVFRSTAPQTPSL